MVQVFIIGPLGRVGYRIVTSEDVCAVDTSYQLVAVFLKLNGITLHASFVLMYRTVGILIAP